MSWYVIQSITFSHSNIIGFAVLYKLIHIIYLAYLLELYIRQIVKIGHLDRLISAKVFVSQYNLNFVVVIPRLPPPRQPSGIGLASSAGGPGFNPQSRTASYQRRCKNGTSSYLVQHSTLKRKILALSQELRQENKSNG